jgi:hypothetical protein
VADGSGLREKLDARISVARRKLFWPSLVRSALPAALWFTGFAVFWLTGLYTAMPPEAQAMAGVVFWIGLLTFALLGLKVWRNPTEDEARDLLRNSPGLIVIDQRHDKGYMTPKEVQGEFPVFVSRIRRDPTVEHGLNMWVVADNLRKGAALNAVQIAQLLDERGLIGGR